MHNAPHRRLALLIDAENVPARHAEMLMQEVARHGEPIVRRAYGDFTQGHLAEWTLACPVLGIQAQQLFIRTSGKNAADIALVIDAMDLLHRGLLSGFCLVSSDGDFSRLAERLREQGVAVFGFGETKTPECFRRACREFTDLERLELARAAPQPDIPDTAMPIAPPAPDPPSVAVDSALQEEGRKLLARALRKCPKEPDGSVDGSRLIQHVRGLDERFTLSRFGHNKFRKFVEAAGGFKVAIRDKRMLIRLQAVN